LKNNVQISELKTQIKTDLSKFNSKNNSKFPIAQTILN